MGIIGVDYKFSLTSLGLPGNSNKVCTFQACCLYKKIVGNNVLPE